MGPEQFNKRRLTTFNTQATLRKCLPHCSNHFFFVDYLLKVIKPGISFLEAG